MKTILVCLALVSLFSVSLFARLHYQPSPPLPEVDPLNVPYSNSLFVEPNLPGYLWHGKEAGSLRARSEIVP